MGDVTDELCALLSSAGIRTTYDRDRSNSLPCILCGEKDAPRTLVTIGVYLRPMGGNILPGDPIRRPLCAPCELRTQP